MAEEIIKTYRRSHAPDIVEESSGTSVAIVAIVVVLLIALVAAIFYWNDVFVTKETVIIGDTSPQTEIVRESTIRENTNTRETNTIIQPSPTQSEDSASSPSSPSSDQGGTY